MCVGAPTFFVLQKYLSVKIDWIRDLMRGFLKTEILDCVEL